MTSLSENVRDVKTLLSCKISRMSPIMTPKRCAWRISSIDKVDYLKRIDFCTNKGGTNISYDKEPTMNSHKLSMLVGSVANKISKTSKPLNQLLALSHTSSLIPALPRFPTSCHVC